MRQRRLRDPAGAERWRADRQDMVEVVLEASGGAGPAADVGVAPPATTARRRRAPRVVAAVLATAALVAVVDATLLGQEPTSPSTPAHVPGAAGDLSEPLRPLWEVDAPVGVTLAADLALIFQLEVLRSDSILQAIDLTTGEVRWTVPRHGRDGVAWCQGEAGTEDRQVVVCWRLERTTVTDGVLLALDVDDGSVVAEHAMDLPSVGYGSIDGDVVLGNRTRDELVVRRVDPVTGTLVWESALGLRARMLDGSYTAWIAVQDGFVVVHGPTSAVLSAQDGRLLGVWHTPDVPGELLYTGAQGADVVTTPAGFATWDQLDGSVRSPVGTWHDRSGEPTSRLDGFLAEPAVSDGSAPEVVLTHGDDSRLRATDVRSGQVLWSAQETGHALVRQDGVVVVAAPGQVVGIDLVDGTERWSTRVPGVRPEAGVVTDGRRVVVAAQDEGRWLLQAVDLKGAGVVWSAAAPTAVGVPTGGPDDAAGWLRPVGGSVVVGAGGRLVGMG